MRKRSLRDISDKLKFESGSDDILQEFYVPALERAVKYNRIAGFFSSTSLAIAADGFSEFFIKNGQMKIICSAHISEEDAKSIADGELTSSSAIGDLSLEDIRNEIILNRIKILSWLIRHKKLQIKVSLFKNSRGDIIPHTKTRSLHHSKTGVMEDSSGEKISFSGSINESASGWGKHIEEFKVFRSWIPGQNEYLEQDESNFDNYWSGRNKHIELLDIPKAIEKKLISFSPKSETELNEEIAKFAGRKLSNRGRISGLETDDCPSLPRDLIWRTHQEQAIKSWIKKKGRGVFKMATGAGKTKSALGALTRLYDILKGSDNLPLVLIIVCPYQHLVTQWSEECHHFGFTPIECFRSRHQWENNLNKEVVFLETKIKKFLPIISTNATFASSFFQNIISELTEKILLICDEAHNLGSETIRGKLLKNASFRLALSATFDRHYDEEGTESLKKYFGDICINFGLKEAIESGCLCQYNYYPILVELTNEENEEYNRLSTLIRKNSKINNESKVDDEKIKILQIKRSRIIAGAKNKFSKLKEIFSKMRDYDLRNMRDTLVFCGDGNVEEESDVSVIRQVDQVTRYLGNDLSLRVKSYTAKDSHESRKDITDSFKDGQIQAIVAIKCLDEGVDIPSAKYAYFLSSTTNPRQFIQRRGRVLRKDPQNPDKVAQVYDFLVIPDCTSDHKNDTFSIERGLVKREVTRAMDFANYALNQYESKSVFLEIQDKYRLLGLGE